MLFPICRDQIKTDSISGERGLTIASKHHCPLHTKISAAELRLHFLPDGRLLLCCQRVVPRNIEVRISQVSKVVRLSLKHQIRKQVLNARAVVIACRPGAMMVFVCNCVASHGKPLSSGSYDEPDL